MAAQNKSQIGTPLMILIAAIGAIVIIGIVLVVSERDTTPTQQIDQGGGDVTLQTDIEADVAVPATADPVAPIDDITTQDLMDDAVPRRYV